MSLFWSSQGCVSDLGDSVTVSLGAECVFGCPVCLWVPSVSLGSAKCAAMCCTNTTVATISPARCPLPPGRPKTEGGGRRSRLSHRAGSAHLNQGGYCDGCAEEEVEVVEKEPKGCEMVGFPQSSLINIAMTIMMVLLRMAMRLT